jgi:radical SAM superfamily enzyme YgiQ (UPF0313 family)
MGVPLGLITFAATLPQHWHFRLVDLNVADWDEESWQWADLVCVGGMIAQQLGTLEVVRRARREGKFVVVGGVDATSQPNLYKDADALVLGEAESVVPEWLCAWRAGDPAGTFRARELPDVTQSPVPRFDLLDLPGYMAVNVQHSRGCPFNCEFCDIIELFGRKPRTKTPEQFCRELDRLDELGYRGWIDIVDDNFVGNKRNVKQTLPALQQWCEVHRFPFFFSTQASINLADDETLMRQMSGSGFRFVFIGIETPDKNVLETTQKRMNALKPLSARIRRIFEHGMGVTAGFILGLDRESGDAADVMINCIEDNAIPIASTSLLIALPNTQLTRRLRKEGRLLDSRTWRPVAPDEPYELVIPSAIADSRQSNFGVLPGLNFTTTRDRFQILEDYRRLWTTIYEPKRYFRRVIRWVKQLSMKRTYDPNLAEAMRNNLGFFRTLWSLSKKRDVRWPLWWTVLRCLCMGRRRFERAMQLVVIYAQFERLRHVIDEGVPKRSSGDREKGIPSQCQPGYVSSETVPA